MALKDVEKAIRTARELISDEEYHEILTSHETNTRYMIIDPILRGLGWDLSDPDHVEFELDSSGYGRIDYTLYSDDNPVILLEAKVLHAQSVTHERQLISYTQGVNKGYAVLTNGDTWKIWDLRKRGAFDKKLIAEIDIEEGTIGNAAKALNQTLRRSLF